MRKLNKHKGIMSFEDAFKHMGQKEGYGKLLTRYCPKCGNPLLVFQIVCLECGMVATFESKIARSTQSVDYLKVVEAGALAITAGPAPRTVVAAADTAASSSDVPKEPRQLSVEAKEKTMAIILEYGGATKLSSMRAMMANIHLEGHQVKAQAACLPADGA